VVDQISRMRSKVAQLNADVEEMRSQLRRLLEEADDPQAELHAEEFEDMLHEMEENLRLARGYLAYAEQLANKRALLQEHAKHKDDRWGDVFGKA
jgi:hypothetical protein